MMPPDANGQCPDSPFLVRRISTLELVRELTYRLRHGPNEYLFMPAELERLKEAMEQADKKINPTAQGQKEGDHEGSRERSHLSAANSHS